MARDPRDLSGLDPVELIEGVWTDATHARVLQQHDRIKQTASEAWRVKEALRAERQGYEWGRPLAEEYRSARRRGEAGMREYLANRGLDGDAELDVFENEMKPRGLLSWLFGG